MALKRIGNAGGGPDSNQHWAMTQEPEFPMREEARAMQPGVIRPYVEAPKRGRPARGPGKPREPRKAKAAGNEPAPLKAPVTVSLPVPEDKIEYVMMTMRIPRDLLEWLKKDGPGYQPRMVAVLEAFRQNGGKFVRKKG